jgi:hypothetical protein
MSKKPYSARRLIQVLGWKLSLIIVLNGCGTMKLPKYEPQPVEQYQYSKKKNGLAIAIYPMTNREETKKYFGTDLLSSNVLAVLVVADNRSSSSSFILSKDKLSLYGIDFKADSAVSHNDVTDPSAGTAINTAGAVFVSAPLLIIGAQMFSNSAAIKHNFRVKEMQSQTISPKEKTHGFAYFQLPEENRLPDQLIVHLEVIEIASKEMISFDIPFKY